MLNTLKLKGRMTVAADAEGKAITFETKAEADTFSDKHEGTTVSKCGLTGYSQRKADQMNRKYRTKKYQAAPFKFYIRIECKK